MAKSLSPLRYPGGKSKIYEKVRNLIIANGYEDRTYVEPFAGGFGIGVGFFNAEGRIDAEKGFSDKRRIRFWQAVSVNLRLFLCAFALKAFPAITDAAADRRAGFPPRPSP